MKYTILLSMLLCILQAYSQPEIEISTPVSVTNYNVVYGKHLPRLGMFDDGRVVVLWSKSAANSKIWMAIQEGAQFADPVQVPTGSVNPDVYGSGLGPNFAVKDSLIFVVFEKYGEAIYGVKSTDRGLNFSEPVVVYQPPAGRYATLPAVAFTNDNNPMVGFITSNSGEQDAVYEIAMSTNGGASFENPVVASSAADGNEVCECCPSSLWMDSSGDIYLSFRNNDDNERDIWVTKSINGGTDFPIAADVDETDWIIQGCPSTGPQSFDMGSDLLNVFFSDGADWETGVYISSLNKESMVAGESIKLPTFDGLQHNQYFPRIAGQGDTLGMVWQEPLAGGNTEIIFAYSTTGVQGLLTQPTNLSDTIKSQTFADIIFHQNRFHIVYEDQNSGTVLYQHVLLQEPLGTDVPDGLPVKLHIYPNPVTDHITISCLNGQASQLLITDVLGKVIYQNAQFLDQEVLNVQEWRPGIYLLRIASKTEQLQAKFLVR